MEALAAAAILRERVPDLKLRFVNVVDLHKLQPATEHPHGSTEREFDSLFTTDKPIIFNFHASRQLRKAFASWLCAPTKSAGAAIVSIRPSWR